MDLYTIAITSLLALLTWIGSRVHTKLDELGNKLETGMANMNLTLTSIERDLREELSTLDRRVSHIEGRIEKDIQ